MSHSKTPYIEYSVVHIGYSEEKKSVMDSANPTHLISSHPKIPAEKRAFLDFLAKQKRLLFKGPFLLKGTNQDPILRIDCSSDEEFYQAFNRLTPMMEAIMEEITVGEVLPEDFSSLIPKSGNHPEGECFLILKLRTNRLSLIQQNYEFLFRTANYLQWGLEIEALADGFLLFYETEEDFWDTQINHLNIDDLIRWLKEKNALEPVHLARLQTFFSHRQTSDSPKKEERNT